MKRLLAVLMSLFIAASTPITVSAQYASTIIGDEVYDLQDCNQFIPILDDLNTNYPTYKKLDSYEVVPTGIDTAKITLNRTITSKGIAVDRYLLTVYSVIKDVKELVGDSGLFPGGVSIEYIETDKDGNIVIDEFGTVIGGDTNDNH